MRLAFGRAWCFAAAGIVMLALAPSAGAHTFKVLYSFCAQTHCADGLAPHGGVIMDAQGNLFGTAWEGGDYIYSDGYGIAYKLAPGADGADWTYQRLYGFCPDGVDECPDGAAPSGKLVLDVNGNLYGTAEQGGGEHNSIVNGGTAFELTPNPPHKQWKLHRLHWFCPDECLTDGRTPIGGFTYAGEAAGAPYDGASPLYGVTAAGGANEFSGEGVVYSLTPKAGTGRWTEKVLHNFCDESACSDGTRPLGGLVMDNTGNVLGTTSQGGVNGGGVVFELQPKTLAAENVLYNFCSTRNCKDGMAPAGGLALAPSGDVIGTTQSAGQFCDFDACGTVFRLSAGAPPQFARLHSFCAQFDCRDGKVPLAGAAIDAAGNIYGTASQGGGNDLEDTHGGGVVFEVDSAANFHVLHRFCAKKGCADGDHPLGDLIVDASGNVFGTTSAGGAYGGGEVFEITP